MYMYIYMYLYLVSAVSKQKENRSMYLISICDGLGTRVDLVIYRESVVCSKNVLSFII